MQFYNINSMNTTVAFLELNVRSTLFLNGKTRVNCPAKVNTANEQFN